jgi:hypothetical protein
LDFDGAIAETADVGLRLAAQAGTRGSVARCGGNGKRRRMRVIYQLRGGSMTRLDHGRAPRCARKLAVFAASACAAIAVAPAVASATTVWVSSTGTVKPPFNSCASPGYNAIQEAINVNAPATTIHVCKGTYKEQLTISKPIAIAGEAGESILELPASPANSVGACDVQEPGSEEQDQVTICMKGTVKISGLTINSKWTALDCAKQFYGVLVGGGAALTMTSSSILHAGAEPINGCQQGVGLQIGHNKNKQVGIATLSGDTITGYQKNGMTIDGPGSTATINKQTKVTSAITNQIAQNGIQVSRGATAKISETTIEGNECAVASCGANSTGFSPWQEEEDATGILFYLSGKGSSVMKNAINGNDIGVYHLAQEETTSPQTTLTANKLSGNRYWGIALDQGLAALNRNTISGPGNVGIQIVQYDEEHNGLAKQEFGARGTGSTDTVSGMSVCGVEGLSDNGVNDQFAQLILTKSLSKFSGNTQNTCSNNTTKKMVISVK